MIEQALRNKHLRVALQNYTTPEPSRHQHRRLRAEGITGRTDPRACDIAPRRDSDDELNVAVVSNAIHLAADTRRVITCPFISFPAGCRTTPWQLRRWCRLVRQAQR
jgi:hypothetical protein